MRPVPMWKNKLALTAAFGGIVLVMYAVKAGCLIERLTGIICPGCGLTRAVLAIARLEVRQAFSWHPMVWSLPVLYLFFLYDGRLFRRAWINRVILGVIAAGFLINWALRLAAMCR